LPQSQTAHLLRVGPTSQSPGFPAIGRENLNNRISLHKKDLANQNLPLGALETALGARKSIKIHRNLAKGEFSNS
jgi:hypothetical protein